MVRGRTTFEWLEGEHFLIQRSTMDHPDFPDAVAVIGEVDGALQSHYFDSRGVHRVYATGFADGTWTLHREAPEFDQRFSGTFSEDGATITGAYEMRQDGTTWEHDMAATYRRVA